MFTPRALLERILDFILPELPIHRALRSLSAEDLAKKLGASVRPLPVENAHALFDYRDNIVRAAIWALKYRGDKRIAHLFAEALSQYLVEELFELEALGDFREPLLIPVPLSPHRLKERGFNQTELLATELLAHHLLPLELHAHNLRKDRETAAQTTLPAEKRKENLAGAFSLARPKLVANRNIMLLDDVITTGSTMEEIKTVLSKAGAKTIVSLALAH